MKLKDFFIGMNQSELVEVVGLTEGVYTISELFNMNSPALSLNIRENWGEIRTGRFDEVVGADSILRKESFYNKDSKICFLQIGTDTRA